MVFKERLNLILMGGKRFDEYIYAIIFLSILVPHFLLPVAAWTNGHEVAKFKNMWTRFQVGQNCMLYCTIQESDNSYKQTFKLGAFETLIYPFQLKYFQVTGTPIIFHNLSLISWALCIISWVAGIAIMLAQYYLQPDMLLWHTFGYFHILAMLNGLCSLWFINCTAKGRVAKWLARSVHKAIESDPDPATRLEEYRDLWVSVINSSDDPLL